MKPSGIEWLGDVPRIGSADSFKRALLRSRTGLRAASAQSADPCISMAFSVSHGRHDSERDALEDFEWSSDGEIQTYCLTRATCCVLNGHLALKVRERVLLSRIAKLPAQHVRSLTSSACVRRTVFREFALLL